MRTTRGTPARTTPGVPHVAGRLDRRHRVWLAAAASAGRSRRDLLDMGCGPAYFTRRFAGEAELRVVGLDPNASWVDFARAHRKGSEQYCVGTAETLPFVDQSFDTSISVTALCFVDDARRAVREILRVTRKRFAVSPAKSAQHVYLQKGRDGGSGAYRGAHWHTAREIYALFDGLPAANLKVRSAVFLAGGGPIARGVESLIRIGGGSENSSLLRATCGRPIRSLRMTAFKQIGRRPERAPSGRTRPVDGNRYELDALDDDQIEVLARRSLLSVDLFRDRAGDIILNDRHDFQFQKIGRLGVNLRERGLGTFDEVKTSARTGRMPSTDGLQALRCRRAGLEESLDRCRDDGDTFHMIMNFIGISSGSWLFVYGLANRDGRILTECRALSLGEEV